MLTISELATYVGVTVRAVRHYHQRGLLAEPERDAAGYRRYDAQAVVDLIRVKTLADAGVPLARIKDLLAAEPGKFAEAVHGIDAELARRIEELREYRRRLARLASGERLYLPAPVADFLDGLRRCGISARLVRMEREAWVLLAARMPEQVTGWATEKLAALDDPAFVAAYAACDAALDLDPADPRLADIADEIVRTTAGYLRADDGFDRVPATVVDPTAEELLSGYLESRVPAWRRINQLVDERVAAHRAARPAPSAPIAARSTNRG